MDLLKHPFKNACQHSDVFPFLFISTLSFIVHVFLPASFIIIFQVLKMETESLISDPYPFSWNLFIYTILDAAHIVSLDLPSFQKF